MDSHFSKKPSRPTGSFRGRPAHPASGGSSSSSSGAPAKRYYPDSPRPYSNYASSVRPAGRPSGRYPAPRSRFGGSSSFARAGARPGGYSTRRPASRFGMGQYIDPSRFVNKAVITEEVEHFIPEHKFTDFKIVPELKQAIVAKGYISPTPIQDRTIPHILVGQDVVGIANTGTGKTAAFLIPLINKVLLDRKENILVVVPTRELALQIDQELKEFTKGMRIFSVCCVGGAGLGRQMADLRHHNNFVIGTPGRLKDLIQKKSLNLATYKTLVLDEADRMLDMGFIHDIRAIAGMMLKPRHTLFFSATLSSDIEKLIHDFLTEPVRISVKTRDTSKNVEQDVIRVSEPAAKIAMLEKLLAQPGFEKVLIFGRTKHGVNKLAQVLTQSGFKAESIHGNKSQPQRQKALKLFKDNHSQVLVATDVAARGLDIPDVTHVINFDVPATYEDYIHRIGRTGRGDKKGKALTFVS
jgi:superfamily II DNA/RNA helicase